MDCACIPLSCDCVIDMEAGQWVCASQEFEAYLARGGMHYNY